MTEAIDRMIKIASPGGAALADLEAGVWRRIEARRARRRTSQVRLAVMVMALIVGAANGGLFILTPKPRPSDIQVFSVSAGLSPLSRLEVGG